MYEIFIRVSMKIGKKQQSEQINSEQENSN